MCADIDGQDDSGELSSFIVDIDFPRNKFGRATSYKTTTDNLIPQLAIQRARDELLLFLICKLDFWDLIVKKEDEL